MKEYIEREIVLAITEDFLNANKNKLGYPSNKAPVYHMLKTLTAADVTPVVHGRWYDENSFDFHGSPIYRCSVCNKTVADNYISFHKFCLHCGAKMDGGSE